MSNHMTAKIFLPNCAPTLVADFTRICLIIDGLRMDVFDVLTKVFPPCEDLTAYITTVGFRMLMLLVFFQ